MDNVVQVNATSLSSVEKRVITQTFIWMTLGLALTGTVAYYASQSATFTAYLMENSYLMWGLVIANIGLVIAIVGAIDKMSAGLATALFFGYAGLNGLTFSFIFLIYSIGSISTAFLITSGTFAVMSVYGLTTKQDLTSMRSILITGLVGIVIASVVNIFLASSMLDLIISIVGVLVFTGLIAYDSQKIKNTAARVNSNEAELKLSVIGALSLYLDFINLFLMLLRFFGGSRSE